MRRVGGFEQGRFEDWGRKSRRPAATAKRMAGRRSTQSIGTMMNVRPDR
jgi:hypothetical protein